MTKKVIATLVLLSAVSTYASAAALRVAADAVPHRETLNHIQETDKHLDLKAIEINGNLNANELLARGAVDATHLQPVPSRCDP